MPSNIVSIVETTGHAPTNADLADCLRQLAVELCSVEDECSIRTVVVVLETSRGILLRRVYGGPIDRARLVGVLFSTAQQCAAGTVETEFPDEKT